MLAALQDGDEWAFGASRVIVSIEAFLELSELTRCTETEGAESIELTPVAIVMVGAELGEEMMLLPFEDVELRKLDFHANNSRDNPGNALNRYDVFGTELRV